MVKWWLCSLHPNEINADLKPLFLPFLLFSQYLYNARSSTCIPANIFQLRILMFILYYQAMRTTISVCSNYIMNKICFFFVVKIGMYRLMGNWHRLCKFPVILHKNIFTNRNWINDENWRTCRGCAQIYGIFSYYNQRDCTVAQF